MDGLFSVGYLTLMAIIQGAAFGLLFLSVQQQLAHFMWSAHAVLVLVQAFATALAIVIVTQEYLLLTQVAWWTPAVFDTLIPYLLGFGEIWMALANGHSTSWWIALCSLCGGAVLAFSYTANRGSAPVPGRTIEIQDQLRGTIIIQVVLSAVMLITGLTLAILNYSRALPASLNIALTGAVTLIGVLIVIVGQHTQNKVYDHYRLPRWHPLSRRNHS